MNIEFDLLTTSLQTPLPTQHTQSQQLRELVAEAEAYGLLISQYLRTISSHLEDKTAEALAVLKDDEVYTKCNADEKKILLYAQVSELKAKMEYTKNLENLIKRRVTLGQSFIKSFNEGN